MNTCRGRGPVAQRLDNPAALKEYLAAYPTQANETTPGFRCREPVLFAAVHKSNAAAVRTLLDAGADVNAEVFTDSEWDDGHPDTAVAIACRYLPFAQRGNGPAEVLAALLEHPGLHVTSAVRNAAEQLRATHPEHAHRVTHIPPIPDITREEARIASATKTIMVTMPQHPQGGTAPFRFMMSPVEHAPGMVHVWAYSHTEALNNANIAAPFDDWIPGVPGVTFRVDDAPCSHGGVGCKPGTRADIFAGSNWFTGDGNAYCTR